MNGKTAGLIGKFASEVRMPQSPRELKRNWYGLTQKQRAKVRRDMRDVHSNVLTRRMKDRAETKARATAALEAMTAVAPESAAEQA